MLVESDSLTEAWVQGFLATYDDTLVSPLVVTVSGFHGSPPEDAAVRDQLDDLLAAKEGAWPTGTTANTIFPSSMWHPGANRTDLYARYSTLYAKRLKRMRANRLGTYFQRLIDHGPEHVNQVETVIDTWGKGVRRRSALVASVFDPMLDHRPTRQRGFPCLHQVCFAPEKDGGFSVTGFYAKQDIFERGYGNYLGLARLGRFVAVGCDSELTRLTCVAAQAGMSSGRFTKGELATFVGHLRAR